MAPPPPAKPTPMKGTPAKSLNPQITPFKPTSASASQPASAPRPVPSSQPRLGHGYGPYSTPPSIPGYPGYHPPYPGSPSYGPYAGNPQQYNGQTQTHGYMPQHGYYPPGPQHVHPEGYAHGHPTDNIGQYAPSAGYSHGHGHPVPQYAQPAGLMPHHGHPSSQTPAHAHPLSQTTAHAHPLAYTPQRPQPGQPVTTPHPSYGVCNPPGSMAAYSGGPPQQYRSSHPAYAAPGGQVPSTGHMPQESAAPTSVEEQKAQRDAWEAQEREWMQKQSWLYGNLNGLADRGAPPRPGAQGYLNQQSSLVKNNNVDLDTPTRTVARPDGNNNQQQPSRPMVVDGTSPVKKTAVQSTAAIKEDSEASTPSNASNRSRSLSPNFKFEPTSLSLTHLPTSQTDNNPRAERVPNNSPVSWKPSRGRNRPFDPKVLFARIVGYIIQERKAAEEVKSAREAEAAEGLIALSLAVERTTAEVREAWEEINEATAVVRPKGGDAAAVDASADESGGEAVDDEAPSDTETSEEKPVEDPFGFPPKSDNPAWPQEWLWSGAQNPEPQSRPDEDPGDPEDPEDENGTSSRATVKRTLAALGLQTSPVLGSGEEEVKGGQEPVVSNPPTGPTSRSASASGPLTEVELAAQRAQNTRAHAAARERATAAVPSVTVKVPASSSTGRSNPEPDQTASPFPPTNSDKTQQPRVKLSGALREPLKNSLNGPGEKPTPANSHLDPRVALPLAYYPNRRPTLTKETSGQATSSAAQTTSTQAPSDSSQLAAETAPEQTQPEATPQNPQPQNSSQPEAAVLPCISPAYLESLERVVQQNAANGNFTRIINPPPGFEGHPVAITIENMSFSSAAAEFLYDARFTRRADLEQLLRPSDPHVAIMYKGTSDDAADRFLHSTDRWQKVDRFVVQMKATRRVMPSEFYPGDPGAPNPITRTRSLGMIVNLPEFRDLVTGELLPPPVGPSLPPRSTHSRNITSGDQFPTQGSMPRPSTDSRNIISGDQVPMQGSMSPPGSHVPMPARMSHPSAMPHRPANYIGPRTVNDQTPRPSPMMCPTNDYIGYHSTDSPTYHLQQSAEYSMRSRVYQYQAMRIGQNIADMQASIANMQATRGRPLPTSNMAAQYQYQTRGRPMAPSTPTPMHATIGADGTWVSPLSGPTRGTANIAGEQYSPNDTPRYTAPLFNTVPRTAASPNCDVPDGLPDKVTLPANFPPKPESFSLPTLAGKSPAEIAWMRAEHQEKESARRAKLNQLFYGGSRLHDMTMDEMVEEMHLRHMLAWYCHNLGITRAQFEAHYEKYGDPYECTYVPPKHACRTMEEILQQTKPEIAKPFVNAMFLSLLMQRAEPALPEGWKTTITTPGNRPAKKRHPRANPFGAVGDGRPKPKEKEAAQGQEAANEGVDQDEGESSAAQEGRSIRDLHMPGYAS